MSDTLSRAEEVTNQTLDDLRELREIVHRSIQYLPEREHIDMLLERAELAVDWLYRQLADLSVPEEPEMATDQEFNVLLGAIDEAFPDGDRLQIIRDMGTGGRYSSRQVAALLRAFSFDTDREKAAVLLYSKVVDKENFYIALETFDFESNADEVRQQIGLG